MNDCKCCGLFGWMFGHKFEDVFETESGVPAYIPSDVPMQNMDESEMDHLSGLVRDSAPSKDHFVHTVCRRCGRIVNRKDII